MKLYLFLLIFTYSQSAFSQHVDREVFDATLGEEKAQAYTELEKSFEEFLNLNYPHQNSLSRRIHGYLTDVQNQNFNWIYDESLSVVTLTHLENSGLRKDILIYKNETYSERFDFSNYLHENGLNPEIDSFDEIDDDFEEIVEIPLPTRKEDKQLKKEEIKRQKIRDKFPIPNKNGRFYYALAKAQSNNEDIRAYVSLVTKYEERPSPTLIASAFLEFMSDSELIAWENKLIVIVEIYLNSLITNELLKK